MYKIHRDSRKGSSMLMVLLLMLVATLNLKAQIPIQIEAGGQSLTYEFAKSELKVYLGKAYSSSRGGAATWKIVLKTDKNLAAETFSVRCNPRNGQNIVNLTGGNEASMLHAVYTFLEKVGFHFEITGPVAPERLNLEKLKGYSETIVPVVKQRGIRQHINFPMDVSSYPIEEAKEYVRNLARLRFNYIVFHSYPTQWYEIEKQGKTIPAGNFFYGQRHDLPKDQVFSKKIRNINTYCIPAIERFYDQPTKRGEMAIGWLQELMKECKRVGLTIRFTFEPRNKTADVTATVKTVKTILTQYPQIDELELITQETGGVGTPHDEKEIKETLEPLFGKAILEDPIVMTPIRAGNSGVLDVYAEIGHNILAYNAIKDLLTSKGIKESLGLYIVVPEYLRPAYHMLRKYAPGASYAVLAAHGARRVNLQLPETEMTKAEWKKTMIYSWLEFDGIMFLQQNSVRGVRRLIEYGEDVNGSDGIQAICFNHWRTSENRTVARYAALATLYGAADETAFYSSYANSMGFSDTKTYAAAMKKIDDADWFATTDLPNVGFCYAGVWGRTGFGYFGKMDRLKLRQGINMYQEALDLIQRCASKVKNKDGRQYSAFLDNRLRATVVYLKAYLKGTEIQKFDASKKPTDADRKAIAEICNKSILQFEQYLQIHSEMMPDRGCEGTLISAYYTPGAVLKRIRKEYGDVPYETQTAPDKTLDAPPAPIKFSP